MSTTPPARGLIDTSVLVAYREGWPDPVQFMLAIRQSGQQPEFGQLSALALLAWCQNPSERTGVDAFLYAGQIPGITARIARRAQAILETLAPPCGLTADDAIVAATAIEHSLPLYTLDPTRFAGVTGLTATAPY